jgi:hypothetical protein
VEFKSEMRISWQFSKAIQAFELQPSLVRAAVELCRTTGMSGLAEARPKYRRSTPGASTVSLGGEAPENTENLEIHEADIQLLIDFFLQLKKWDKLQSTPT